MEKVLTVVVPSYNVEKYLEKTLDSMCKISNIDDVEIVAVNDGSKDRTLEIAEKYRQMFPSSVVVIDKANGGHGSTINAGVKVAKGKYVKVIDGDDWVDTAQFEVFVEKLKECDTELVLTPFNKVYDESGSKELIHPEILMEEGVYDFPEYITQIYEFYYLHAVTFRTDIYRKTGLSIREHCFYVDTEFILYPIDNIKTFQFLNLCVYQYRLGRPGQSVSMESKIQNKNMHQLVIRDIMENCILADKIDRPSQIAAYLNRKVVTLANIQYSIYLSMKPCKETYMEMLDFRSFMISSIHDRWLHGVSKMIRFFPVSYWIIGIRYRKKYL